MYKLTNTIFMKRIFLCLLIVLVGQTCLAQHTISGTITDSRTGETLIGATVYDTVSKKGTTTNQHGRFTLTLKGERAVVRISFVGYETQHLPLLMSHNQHLDVKLHGSTLLQEVTITEQRVQHVESSQTSVIEVPIWRSARHRSWRN